MNEEPERLTPVMSANELALFATLLSSASSYVEFGSGGSTLLAAQTPNVRRIWSVESDASWVDKIERHPSIAEAVALKRLSLLRIDIGPTGVYGHPIDRSRAATWPAYYERVFEDPDVLGTDLFLVDGRFRVACLINTLLHCRPGATIVVHDFWDRPHYHVALRFTDWVASADTMAVLRPKASLGQYTEDLTSTLAEYAQDVR